MKVENFFGNVIQTALVALGKTKATPWLIDTAAARPGASPSAAMPEGAWEAFVALARIASGRFQALQAQPTEA